MDSDLVTGAGCGVSIVTNVSIMPCGPAQPGCGASAVIGAVLRVCMSALSSVRAQSAGAPCWWRAACMACVCAMPGPSGLVPLKRLCRWFVPAGAGRPTRGRTRAPLSCCMQSCPCCFLLSRSCPTIAHSSVHSRQKHHRPCMGACCSVGAMAGRPEAHAPVAGAAASTHRGRPGTDQRSKP